MSVPPDRKMQLTLQQAFDLAVQRHRSGRLGEAEQLYRQILARAPQHVDAIHLLGLIAFQSGQYDAAVQLIRRALAANPKFADAYNNLGNALLAQGKLAEAIAAYRAAIDARPQYAEAHGNLANALREAGQLDEALSACQRTLSLNARLPEGYFNLGNIHRARKEHEQSIAAYQQAIALRPEFPDALNNLGNAYRDNAQIAEAIAAYEKAIALRPNFPSAWNNLGNAHHDAGQLDQAMADYRRALALAPDYPEAQANLAVALKEKGMVDEAIAAGRRLVALNPDFADAHCNLGLALMEKGLVDEAIDAYRQAISLKPNLAEAWNNLANALKDKKQLDQAIAAYRRCIELKADFAQAYSNLGNALREKGQLPEAIATCRRAIELDPQLAEAHSNLGNALNDMGQLEVAISAFQDAMALDPNLPEAPYNLANVLTERGEVDLAVAAYRQAIALKPDYADAFNNLGNALKEQGLLNEALAAYRQGIAIDPQNATIDSNLIYTLHFLPEADARAIAQEHERWNRQHADPLRKFIVPHGNGRDPRRRLRIGYVSPDFRAHAVGRFLLPLFDHHDKSQFEIFAYANSTYSDFVTERLRSKADAWRNISELSDAAAADLVRGDGIDILVDLTMHMARSRLLIFARKPAPVQVTYLAYCSSTGMRTIDYRLSDPYLDQAGADETLYSEKTIRLPRSYWCFEPILAPPGVAPSPASAQKRVTFGCLNNFCKVSAPAVAAWVKILRSVPQAQLILGAQEGSHRQRLANELSGQGIDPARLSFVGRMPLPDYLRIYNQIDIALDTFPYGGGTTTCDALWMGVPVVSLIGKRAVGRGGLSILSNIGLAELAGGSEQEYVRIAIELANDLPRLSQLRSTLRQRMQQSPLMDAPGFARQIEAAYRQMWQTWCAAPPTG